MIFKEENGNSSILYRFGQTNNQFIPTQLKCNDSDQLVSRYTNWTEDEINFSLD
jgi:hypothetical protein